VRVSPSPTSIRAMPERPQPRPPRQRSIALEVVKLPEAKRGFVLLPRRWVVERSFEWATRCRRLVKDYVRYASALAAPHVALGREARALGHRQVMLAMLISVVSSASLRHPNALPSAVPDGTPSTFAKVNPAIIRAIACARFCGTTRAAATTQDALPAPLIRRRSTAVSAAGALPPRRKYRRYSRSIDWCPARPHFGADRHQGLMDVRS
jgi:hypothetical protein